MGGNLRICQAILEMTNDVQNAVIFMILTKIKKRREKLMHNTLIGKNNNFKRNYNAS